MRRPVSKRSLRRSKRYQGPFAIHRRSQRIPLPVEMQSRELPILRRILQPEGKVILDAGCGNGRLLIPLAKNARKIIGLDAFEPNDIVSLKKNIAKKGIKNAQLIRGDLTRIPLHTNKADASFFVGVIHGRGGFWKEMLKEIVRVTKPGGPIVVVFASGELDFEQFDELTKRSMGKPVVRGELKKFDQSFREWCIKQGLEITRELVRVPIVYPAGVIEYIDMPEFRKFLLDRQKGNKFVIWKKTNIFTVRKRG